ncbi:MAG: hypothetical protein ACE5JS_07815 [Nitrospinota bacterium]
MLRTKNESIGPEFTREPARKSLRNYLRLGLALLAIAAVAFTGFYLWIPVVLGGLGETPKWAPGWLYGYGFFAGLFTFAAPCAIGILPAYLTFYLQTAGTLEAGGLFNRPWARGLAWGARAGLGVAVVYVAVIAFLYSIPRLAMNPVFGFTTTASYLVISAWTKPIILLLLLVFGIALVTGSSLGLDRAAVFLQRKAGIRFSPGRSAFGFGVLYGAGSLGCGLLVVVPLAAVNLLAGKVILALLSFFSYLLGFFAMMVLVTTAVSLQDQPSLQILIRHAPKVRRAAGVVVILSTAWLVNFYLKTGGM